MDQITIRCHPYVPVAVEELDRWLEQEADELRKEAPRGTVRLSRLEQSLPSGNVGVGWLLELDYPGGEPSLYKSRLAATLKELRLLGLQPTLLAPDDPFGDSTTVRDPAPFTAGRAGAANGAAS